MGQYNRQSVAYIKRFLWVSTIGASGSHQKVGLVQYYRWPLSHIRRLVCVSTIGTSGSTQKVGLGQYDRRQWLTSEGWFEAVR